MVSLAAYERQVLLVLAFRVCLGQSFVLEFWTKAITFLRRRSEAIDMNFFITAIFMFIVCAAIMVVVS